MIKRNKILKWLTILFSLAAFQTLTYFTLGPRLLKNKLLPGYLTTLSHRSDSILVRDFYASDCYTGDPNTYISNNLRGDEELIKRKFKVQYVYFEKPESFSLSDTAVHKYNLVYKTWAARHDWIDLFGFYGIRQTETLSIDKKYFYKREATYHWFLFFWIKTFEWVDSSEIKT